MKNPKTKTVELVKTSYQPNKSELNEEFKIDATVEEITDALVQPVKVRWIDKPRPRRTRV